MVLEYKNKQSRVISYAYNKPSANSNWASRNMIISGLTVLAFLAIHFYDFWIPEIQYKYIDFQVEAPERYFEELTHKFHSLSRVVIYVIAFLFLSLHLLHGFQSSFQSVGFSNQNKRQILHKIGNVFAVVVPLGFVFIAIFHFLNQHH